ncbi:MAG: CHAP domain-containing protein [Deltaproteobacteria bacterium]|nr:CHAP domain-containing protein [Deltaproteobacteria bacterium]
MTRVPGAHPVSRARLATAASLAALGLLTACGTDAAPDTAIGLFAREDGPTHSLAFCQDREDNDGDGLFDCADPDCTAYFACSGAASDVADADADADADASVGRDVDAGGAGDTVAADTDPDAFPATCLEDVECDPKHGYFCLAGPPRHCGRPDDYTVAPSPTAYGAMGMVLDAGLPGDPASAGEVVGSFCGVEARWNTAATDFSVARSLTGWSYQSPELVVRYLCRRVRYEPEACPIPLLRADAWWDAAATDPGLAGFVRLPNGGDAPPRAGDVLVFDVAPMGHVALVTRALVGEEMGLVEVLEQGLAESSHAYALTVTDGHYTIPSARGWLRPADGIEGCGASGRLASLSVLPTPQSAAATTLGEAPPRLVAVDAVVHAAGGLGKVELLFPDGVIALQRELGPTAEDAHLLATTPLPAGYHGELRMSLVVSGRPDGPYTRQQLTADTLALRVDPAGDPLPAAFAAAAAEYDVPACLLAAIADAATRWSQGVTTRGASGVMGIRDADLGAAAALVGAPTPGALAAPDAGALNVRGAAALLASWAEGDPGLASGARAAVEAWWPLVARYLGAGLDGDVATSNAVFRVYDRLARGVPGRVPRVAGLDLAAIGAVTSRPATPGELLAGDVTPEDAALVPATPPLHLRRFVPSAAMPRHTCAGACSDDACAEAPACDPESAVACEDGAPVWVDSCGEPGDGAPACVPDGDGCTLDLCLVDGCAHVQAPDGTDCSDGTPENHDVCSAGKCQPRTDADGDEFYADAQPLDCPGHDDDYYIHPGAPELWDVRDNDCDGRSDDQGLVRYTRYKRVWASDDWEHRYSATPLPAPWEAEPERRIELYPVDMCSGYPQSPQDGCCPSWAGDVILDLWTENIPCEERDQSSPLGFTLVALSQCSGVFASGKHVSLLLVEDGGEYGDYRQLATFECRRLGYVLGPAARASMPSSVQIYRLRSPSGAGGVADDLWTADPSAEDRTLYDRTDPVFTVPVAH